MAFGFQAPNVYHKDDGQLKKRKWDEDRQKRNARKKNTFVQKLKVPKIHFASGSDHLNTVHVRYYLDGLT